MLQDTKDKMLKYAETLPPSTARAQCIRIANLSIDGNLAQTIKNDHSSFDGALRAAELMVWAGAAEYIANPEKPNIYGTFTFEDGSTL